MGLGMKWAVEENQLWSDYMYSGVYMYSGGPKQNYVARAAVVKVLPS